MIAHANPSPPTPSDPARPMVWGTASFMVIVTSTVADPAALVAVTVKTDGGNGTFVTPPITPKLGSKVRSAGSGGEMEKLVAGLPPYEGTFSGIDLRVR